MTRRRRPGFVRRSCVVELVVLDLEQLRVERGPVVLLSVSVEPPTWRQGQERQRQAAVLGDVFDAQGLVEVRIIGSLVAGKNADVVLWSGNPFSVYSRAEKVWVDGALLFDRLDAANRWRTDFELGYVAPPGGIR